MRIYPALILSLVAAAAVMAPASTAVKQRAGQQPRSVSGRATVGVPRIVVNGRVVQTDVAPRIIQGTTLIPIRFVAEALGATVTWHPGDRQAVIDYEGQRVAIVVGENTMVAGSRTVHTNVPTQVIQGRTMIPLRAVAESLGADVRWDAPSQTVFVRMTLPEEEPGAVSSDAAIRSSVEVDASVGQQSYHAGTPVDLTLRMHNKGTRPIRLLMRSGQMYDFTIQRDGQEVWRWSQGRAFPQVITPLVLSPDETRTFTVTWDQHDSAGNQVPPGTYTVAGTVTHGGSVPLGGTATFRITAP